MSALVRRRDVQNFAFNKSTLSIDPGSKGLAWAEWQGATLITCGLERSELVAIEDRAAYFAKAFVGECFDCVVVERMTHYPTANAKDAKANDLLDLQLIGGYVAGAVIAPHGQFLSVRAPEWKGQVPKDVMNRRCISALSAPERAALDRGVEDIPRSLHHNVLDAIGIGLWFFGRLGK